jgi:hypothetical protein
MQPIVEVIAAIPALLDPARLLPVAAERRNSNQRSCQRQATGWRLFWRKRCSASHRDRTVTEEIASEATAERSSRACHQNRHHHRNQHSSPKSTSCPKNMSLAGVHCTHYNFVRIEFSFLSLCDVSIRHHHEMLTRSSLLVFSLHLSSAVSLVARIPAMLPDLFSRGK